MAPLEYCTRGTLEDTSGGMAARAKAPVPIKSRWTCDPVSILMTNPNRLAPPKMADDWTNGALLYRTGERRRWGNEGSVMLEGRDEKLDLKEEGDRDESLAG